MLCYSMYGDVMICYGMVCMDGCMHMYIYIYICVYMGVWKWGMPIGLPFISLGSRELP